MKADKLSSDFLRIFGHEPDFALFSPGRINVIGEHIDYCGGLVLPMAISLGTSAVFSRNNTSRVRVYSDRYHELREFNPHDVIAQAEHHWGDYVNGVLRALGERRSGDGFDIYVTDNLSAGGLSSSASFSMSLAIAVTHIVTGQPLAQADHGQRLDLALKCQRAENEFVGVACGIMDQASIALGGVIRLDCSSLSFERIPIDLGEYQIVIMDTGQERTLAGSAYNARVNETSKILECLKQKFTLKNLAALAPGELEPALTLLDDELLARRLMHIVSEQQRVISACEAIQRGDLKLLGELMDASHASLALNFEVTGDALDLITGLSRDCEGVLGSRMIGAGFGGCAISLVHRDAILLHRTIVTREYQKVKNLTPTLLVAEPARGAESYLL